MNQAATNPLPVPTPCHLLWADSTEWEMLLQGSGVRFSWVLWLRGEKLLGAVTSHPLLLRGGSIWCVLGQLCSAPPVIFSPILATFLPPAPSAR